MALVELNVMEQRYRAVMEVIEHGQTVTDVAARYGVSRQSVHTWVAASTSARRGVIPATLGEIPNPARHVAIDPPIVVHPP